MELYGLDVSESSKMSGGGVQFSVESDDEDEMISIRAGPPSEASSQEWDKISDSLNVP